jgi:hypothetical protein
MDFDLPLFWAILLIAAASVSLAFTVRRIRAGTVGGLAAAGAVVFRAGLIAVGAVYAAGLAASRTALLIGFGVVAIGAILNLLGAVAVWRRGVREAAETGELDEPDGGEP